MTTATDLLASPPRSWSTLHADLVRLRRHYSFDDETAGARSYHSNRLDEARIALLDALLAHIEPAVADEAASYELDQQRQREAAEDRWDAEAKQR